jgi:hypothetical protein
MSSFIASRDYIKGNFFISTILQESFTVVNEITIGDGDLLLTFPFSSILLKHFYKFFRILNTR